MSTSAHSASPQPNSAKGTKAKKAKGPMSNKKFMAIWIPIVAVLAILAIGANIAVGYWRTAIESYMGTGTYETKNTAEGEKLNTEYYTSDFASLDAAKKNSASVVEEVAAEGTVLLKNNGSLPMAAGNVTLLGRGAADPVYGGSGSGWANTATATDIKKGIEGAGFKVNPTVYAQLADFAKANPASEGGRTNIVMDKPEESNYKIGEMPVADYSQESKDSFAKYNDAAIVVIGRGGGEGGDLATDMTAWDDKAQAGEHQLELNTDEKELIALAKDNFETVVVLVNASTSMELGILEDDPDVDAILQVGSPGNDGFKALGPILAGDINPSGHTTDIFAADFTKDPTFVNFGNYAYSNIDGAYFVDYEEGIYVGYRYYETAAAEGFINYDEAVVYPFGYGLSYTTFGYKVTGQKMGETTGQISVDVEVTNTGDVAGKEVVELYYTAPYTKGGIEKSSVVLGAFAKTDLIEPGQSETVTLTFNVEDMASFDDQDVGAYVLEKGDYQIKVQTDSHTLAPGTEPLTYTVDETITYKAQGRQSDAVPAVSAFADVTKKFDDGEATKLSRANFAETFPTAPTEADLKASEATVQGFDTYDAKAAAEQNAEVKAPTWDADTELTLADMRGLDYEDPKWDELLNSLNKEEAVALLTSGAYNTAAIPEIGKIRTDDIDGPAGFSSFINPEKWAGTAFTTNYLLAQTWNPELAQKMGNAIGNEALHLGAEGWYAPAINTHRSPFAGRNFEYFSEDPVLSGVLATQVQNGALEKGVYSFTKHFAMNDQETNRVNGKGLATWAPEQAIREVYLKPFELTVKNTKGEMTYLDSNGKSQTRQIGSTAIMSSFNRIGTTWAGGSPALMHTVLREEWGFTGFTITDFNLYDYMSVDQAWDARGTDHMLTFLNSKTVQDTESAYAQQNIRYAMHNVLFTVANSNATNGMASGATLEYHMATWEIGVLAGTVLLGLLALAGLAWIIVRVRRHGKPDQPQVVTESGATA